MKMSRLAAVVLSLAPLVSVQAADPTQMVTITGTVVSKTCTFDSTTPATVVLDDIGAREFTDTAPKKIKSVPVSITCGAGVQSVKIVPSGAAETGNLALYKNTGDSTGVGLQFMGSTGNTALLPQGTSSVTVTPASGTGKGSYTFRAGYAATVPNGVAAGSFKSQVTLNFNYN